MNIFKFLNIDKKNKVENADSHLLNQWYQDSYETTLIQRNFLIILMFIALLIIITSLILIRYIKNNQVIEPFVIEIENKTGVPTVVEPVTIKDYSANESIKRYFIMKYIRAREEYTKISFMYNYSQVVRVLSTSDVYYSDYRPKFSPSNKNSPASMGDKYMRSVELKSLIFQNDNSVQVRLKIIEDSGGSNSSNNITYSDKLVYMEFDFQNIEMNDMERLINPLGFVVKLYRITDEKIL